MNDNQKKNADLYNTIANQLENVKIGDTDEEKFDAFVFIGTAVDIKEEGSNVAKTATQFGMCGSLPAICNSMDIAARTDENFKIAILTVASRFIEETNPLLGMAVKIGLKGVMSNESGECNCPSCQSKKQMFNKDLKYN